jgi:hypothetical protein
MNLYRYEIYEKVIEIETNIEHVETKLTRCYLVDQFDLIQSLNYVSVYNGLDNYFFSLRKLNESEKNKLLELYWGKIAFKLLS